MSAGNSELGSAFITIYPQVDRNFRTTVGREFNKGIDPDEFGKGGSTTGSAFGKGFKNAALVALETLGDLLQDFVHWAMGILSDLTKEALSNEDALIKFDKSMQFAGYGEEEIQALQDQMMEYADRTIFELSDITSLTQQLGAMGVDNFEQLTEAAGNLTAIAGFGAEEFGYFARAIQQINTAGVLKTQDWYQVQNAIGAGAVAIQEELIAMGAFEGGMEGWSDALANGEISAEEFNQAVMNLGMDDAAIEAASSTDTFEGAMGQLRAASVSAIMDIIDTIGMENITGFIGKLAELVPPLIEKLAPIITDLATRFADWIMNMDTEEVADNFGKFIDFLIEYGPVYLNTLFPMISAIEKLIDVVSWLKDTVSPLWNGVLSPMFTAIGEFFGGVGASLGDTIGAIVGNVQGLWDIVSGFWGTLQGIFGSVVGFFQSFSMEDLKAKVTEGVTYIRDYFSTKFDEIRTKVSGVFDSIRTAISTKIDAARQAVSKAIDKIKSYFDFDWHLPDLKLPHISITGDWGFNPPRVPSFGIQWYASGGIFDMPSVIGVGERGPEAVVPLSGSAMQPFAQEVAMNMGVSGMSDEIRALRTDIQNMKLYLDGKTLVGGIADRMDMALGQRQATVQRGF